MLCTFPIEFSFRLVAFQSGFSVLCSARLHGLPSPIAVECSWRLCTFTIQNCSWPHALPCAFVVKCSLRIRPLAVHCPLNAVHVRLHFPSNTVHGNMLCPVYLLLNAVDGCVHLQSNTVHGHMLDRNVKSTIRTSLHDFPINLLLYAVHGLSLHMRLNSLHGCIHLRSNTA